MTAEPLYTRREGDQLAARVEAIDNHGTRGMQLISLQTQANTAALGELRNEVANRFREHTSQHHRELAAITARRRWRVMAAAAVAAALVAVLGFLVTISTQLSHLAR